MVVCSIRGLSRTLVLAAIGLAAVSAHADPVADFYHGKTLNLIIGTSTGNDYDFRARLVAVGGLSLCAKRVAKGRGCLRQSGRKRQDERRGTLFARLGPDASRPQGRRPQMDGDRAPRGR